MSNSYIIRNTVEFQNKDHGEYDLEGLFDEILIYMSTTDKYRKL